MQRFWGLAIGAALLGAPVAAMAEDCPQGYVCASNPQSVVGALQAAGYKAELKPDTAKDRADGDGVSYVSTAGGGYTYEIDFKNCTKGADCQSLEFVATFNKDAANSLAMVNDWNRSKRFSAMYLLTDGRIGLSYDITTTGGLDQPNFADAVDWWANIVLGKLDQFFTDHPAGKNGEPWAPAAATPST